MRKSHAILLTLLAAALAAGSATIVAEDGQLDSGNREAAVSSAPAETAFIEQMNAANDADAAGDPAAAAAYYSAAFRSANTPGKKIEAVSAHNAMLQRLKKPVESEALLKEVLQDESLPPVARRKILVTLAGQIMWGRPDESQQYINQAATIPTTDVRERVETSITSGYIFFITKQPEYALEAWLPVMDEREAHPAHQSSTAYNIANVYRQMGDVENARKYFQLAVDYGKKVQYTFDYSSSEKALEELK